MNMKKSRSKKYDKGLFTAVKNFLLTVFVLMCITALITASEYAGDVTGERLGLWKRDTVTARDIEDFFRELPIVKDILLW